jgi:hypothetical protein
MRRRRIAIGLLVVGLGMLAAWPAFALGLAEARLVQAPDGVLFVVHEGARYRVTPQQMSAEQLGAIPEGPPLAAGLLGPGAAPVAEPPRVVRPEPGMGLSREAPIPLGWTCSCTIDRGGRISQFDITVVRVERNAYPMVQQANRFNKPPLEGNTYLGALIDMKYIAGPQDQAYTIAESDFHITAADAKLRDPSTLIGFGEPFQPPAPLPGGPVSQLRADVYPGSTLTAWVFYEIPRADPAALVWEFSFVGERGVWFALQ